MVSNIQFTRAERLRQKEALRQHRARLTSMLTQKLSKKYGWCKEARSILTKEISGFMSETYQIEDKDLEALELRVSKKTEALRTKKEDRSLKVKKEEKSTLVKEKVEEIAPNFSTPKASTSSKRDKKWLQDHSEWQLLDAYQAIENEEHQKLHLQQAKEKQIQFKKILDEQLEIKRGKLNEKTTQRPSTATPHKVNTDIERQKKLVAEWKQEQRARKVRTQEKYLQEKKERDRQVAEKVAFEQREKDAKRTQELLEVAHILKAEENEKKQAIEKKKEARAHLQKIQEATRREELKRLEIKKAQGVEDQAMMEAYKAKLEAEEEARQTAFSRRMARLAHFTHKSGSEGAGYEKDQANRQAEERILAEAARKEAADLEREKYDKERLRQKQHDIAMENKRLAELKKLQEKKIHDEEQHFSRRYVRESQEYLAAEARKMQEMRQHMQLHALELEKQMHQAKRRTQCIDMDDRERALNRRLLAKITTDETIVDKLHSRLSPSRPSTATAAFRAH